MFNTLKYAKILEEVGFSREQAETSIKILVEIMEDKLASKQDFQDLRLATQQDFQNLKLATQQDFQDLRNELKQTKNDLVHLLTENVTDVRHSILQLESKLTIRMGTMLAGSTAILTAILKLT